MQSNNSLTSMMLDKLIQKLPARQMATELLGVISDVELPFIDASKNLFVTIKPSNNYSSELSASLEYSTAKEKVNIPIELKSSFDDIKLLANQEIKIEAKMVENTKERVELRILNIKFPQEEAIELNDDIVIKDTASSIKNIELSPVKIDVLGKSAMAILEPVSIDVKMVQNVGDIDIDFALVNDAEEMQQVFLELKSSLVVGEVFKVLVGVKKEVVTPEIFASEEQIFAEEAPKQQTPVKPEAVISQKEGQNNINAKTDLNAAVDDKMVFVQNKENLFNNKEVLVIKTPLGNVFPEKNINLPENTKIVLQVKDFIVSDVEDKFVKNDVVSRISSSLEPVKIENPNLFAKLINKIPAIDSPDLMKNLVMAIDANITKNIDNFLGEEIIRELKLSSPEVAVAVEEFSEVVIANKNEPPIKLNNTFRIIEVPFFNGNVFEKLKIAIKHDQKDEKIVNNKKAASTRFVLETNFTKLGEFQFDGFAIKDDKRFDLVIRTQRQMSKDFIANVANVFKKSLTDVDYNGNISINKQEFLRVFEEKEQIKIEGIFI